MKKAKRLLSLLVAMCMVFGLMATAAFADDDAAGYPESEHPYANSSDETWTYTYDGEAPDGIVVQFDEQTYMESGWDYIYIYAGDAVDSSNLIGTYSGTTLAGSAVVVPDTTFTIRLTSDSSVSYWGFAVTGVVPFMQGDLSQGLTTVEDIPSYIWLGDEDPVPTVFYMGEELTEDEDYTLAYDIPEEGGVATITITGIGSYSGVLEVTYEIGSDDYILTAPSITTENVEARYSGSTSTVYFSMSENNAEWADRITSITLTPVEDDGTLTVIEDAEYPNAPKEITLTADDRVSGATEEGGNWYYRNGYIYFNRSEDDPVIFVSPLHDPLVVDGTEYPQTQVYNITISAEGFADSTASIRFCVGGNQAFSIYVCDADGNVEETYSWTKEELEAMDGYGFRNASSSCSMTGFRTFSSMSVTLDELLDSVGVEVGENDLFSLDTDDHYILNQKQTYDYYFGTQRYFLEGIYTDEEFIEEYQKYTQGDANAASDTEILQMLAAYAYDNEDCYTQPAVSYNYVETLIYQEDIGNLELPTEENTHFDSLVAYENSFRLSLGITILDEEYLTFDTGDGSAVATQVAPITPIVSSTNTTMYSSYWARDLYIYRDANVPDEDEEEVEIEEVEEFYQPEDPVNPGYIFTGWYTTSNSARQNESTLVDFSDPDSLLSTSGVAYASNTVYAGWVECPHENLVAVDGTDATCTEDGLTSGVKCADCQMIFTDQEVIEATGHDLVEIEAEEATCTEDGVEAHSVCVNCGALFDAEGTELDPEDVVITANGHALAVSDAVAATDSYNGLTAGVYCTVCGEVLLAQEETEMTYTCPSVWFSDVDQDAWYHADVDYVIANGIMNGTDENVPTFEPDTTLSRAMVAQILYNMEDRPECSVEMPYTDLEDDTWYTDALQWAYAAGVADVSEGEFRPNDDITRQETVIMIYNYAVYKGCVDAEAEASDALAGFPDVDEVSSEAYDAFAWCVENGIINGRADDVDSEAYLAPDGSSSRAEAAAIIARFCSVLEG